MHQKNIIMKKIRLKLLFIFSVVCLSCFLFTETNKKEDIKISELNKLILSNIEAIAESESSGGNTFCVGSGSIDCFGNKVAYIYSGFSLDDIE